MLGIRKSKILGNQKEKNSKKKRKKEKFKKRKICWNKKTQNSHNVLLITQLMVKTRLIKCYSTRENERGHHDEKVIF